MDETVEGLALAPERLRARITRVLAERAHFVRYLVIGGAAFLVDVGLFAALLFAGLHPLLANTIAVGCSMVFSFAVNALANFKVRDRLLPRFVSFLVVCGFGYLISTLILWLGFAVIGLDPAVAKVISLPFVVAMQYAANKHITFGSVLFRHS